jgi:hypothetical protein
VRKDAAEHAHSISCLQFENTRFSIGVSSKLLPSLALYTKPASYTGSASQRILVKSGTLNSRSAFTSARLQQLSNEMVFEDFFDLPKHLAFYSFFRCIAETYRAVVHFPYAHGGTIALYEFYSMGIPIFVPSLQLALMMMPPAENHTSADTNHSWSLNPHRPLEWGSNGNVKDTQSDPQQHGHEIMAALALSTFYQLEHIQYFSSVDHLLGQLVSGATMITISSKMKAQHAQWTEQVRQFWLGHLPP